MVLETSPRQANWGAGGWVGGGGGLGVLVGLGLGLDVGLGVLVGGGGGVKVGVGGSGVRVGGTGVKVGVGGIGLAVGVFVGSDVLVGIGVSVGIGVWVGVIVTVKVGLGVLVGVAVSSGWRARRVLLPMSTMPITPHSSKAAARAAAMTSITTRFLIPFNAPHIVFDAIFAYPARALSPASPLGMARKAGQAPVSSHSKAIPLPPMG
jgi:hypothetical protein